MKNNKFERENVVWTNLELKGLIGDDNSCVKLVRAKKHLGLLPYHLNDINAALKELMKGFLYCYDRELGGSLLAYRKGKLLSNYGNLMGDSPFIHIDIEADFYIFQPEVGKYLKGIVNKVAPNHIGLLVHKGFNASIPKPLGNDKEWIGDTLSIDQEIIFTPAIINFNSKYPYIRGTLNESETSFKPPRKIVPKTEFEAEEEQDKKEEKSQEIEETKEKILRKIKKEIKEEIQEETQDEILKQRKVKKVRKEIKKRKHREEENEEKHKVDKRKKRRIS